MKYSIKGLATKAAAGATLGMVYVTSARAADVTSVEPIQLSGQTLGELINTIVRVALWGIGILAVLYLIYGGVIYVTAGGDAEKASKGRVAITNAIIGIIIIALALAIVQFVIKTPAGQGAGQLGG